MSTSLSRAGPTPENPTRPSASSASQVGFSWRGCRASARRARRPSRGGRRGSPAASARCRRRPRRRRAGGRAPPRPRAPRDGSSLLQAGPWRHARCHADHQVRPCLRPDRARGSRGGARPRCLHRRGGGGRATAVLVTHVHPDHLHPENLRATDAPVFTVGQVAEQLTTDAPDVAERTTVVAPGAAFDVGLPVRAVGEMHNVIHPELPQPYNSGYLLTVGDRRSTTRATRSPCPSCRSTSCSAPRPRPGCAARWRSSSCARSAPREPGHPRPRLLRGRARVPGDADGDAGRAARPGVGATR